MDPIQKLQADRRRHLEAVQNGLEQTVLLKHGASKTQVLVSADQQDAYVNKVLAHHETPRPKALGAANAAGDMLTHGPATQTLLERIKAAREQDQLARLAALEARHAELLADRQNQDAAEEAAASRPFRKKRLSLKDALAEDERLEQLGPRAARKELVASGYIDASEQQDIASDSSDGGADSSLGKDVLSPDWQQQMEAVVGEHPPHPTTMRQGLAADAAPALPPKPAATIIKMLRDGAARMNEVEQGGGGVAGLLELLGKDLPNQEQVLHELCVQHEVVATRLRWATLRPMTYEARRTPTAEQLQRHLKEWCRQQVWGIVDLALRVVEMRPSQAQVAAEVHEWKAKEPLRLMDISRHVADSVLKDCVDEILLEASREALSLHVRADGFAAGLLIEAVVGSRGLIRQDMVLPALQQAEQEAIACAARRERDAAAAGHTAGRAQGFTPHHAHSSAHRPDQLSDQNQGPGGGEEEEELDPDPDDVIMQHALAGGHLQRSGTGTLSMGQVGDDNRSSLRSSVNRSSTRSTARPLATAASHGYGSGTVRAESRQSAAPLPGPVIDWSARQLPLRETARRPGAAEVGAGWAAPPGVSHLTPTPAGQQQRMSDQAHYLLGLQAILQDMRSRRGGRAPYGHTQQLSGDAGQEQNQGPSGGPGVGGGQPGQASSAWLRLRGSAQKVPFAVYPKHEALRASAIETDFWRKVVFRPFFRGEKSPLVWVDKALSHITCLAPSPDGTALVVGTAAGGLVVFDLRGAPSNPLYQVLGEGRSVGPHPPESRRGIRAVAWSSDGCQLAALDSAFVACAWRVRPAPGAVVGEGASRQPVLMQPLFALGPRAAATSGKAALSDVLGAEESGMALRTAAGLAWAHEFTLLGDQPSLLMPQATGDVLHVRTTLASSPLLPSPAPRTLGPTAPRSGSKPPPPLQQQQQQQQQQQPPNLSADTASFLLAPEDPSPKVLHQALHRAHDRDVVYIGYLADGVTMVSVDMQGMVHLWQLSSQHHAQRTGCGWRVPTRTWALPRSIQAYQARGAAYPVWQALSAQTPHTTGVTPNGGVLRGLFSQGSAGRGGESDRAAPLPPTVHDYRVDPALHDTPDELQKLVQDPQGSWLCRARLPWLVHYRWDTTVDKQGRLVRDEILRPHPTMPPGRPLVISSVLTPSGALVCRSKQSAGLIRMDYRMVAASMSRDGNDLVVWAYLAPGMAGSHAWGVMSGHVVRVGNAKPVTPRIEVYDHSGVGACPAYALSPAVDALGSEYLFVGLGCGVVGVYSVATGHLVRELFLGMPTTATHFTALALFPVRPAQVKCPNQGRMLLAAVPSGSLYVHMFEIDDEVGVASAISRRAMQPPLVRVIPDPAPARALAPVDDQKPLGESARVS